MTYRTLLLTMVASSLALVAVGCDDGGDDGDAGTVMTDSAVPGGDADGDTISDFDEGADLELDTDGDGTPDYLDEDSDDDGLPDAFEAGDDDLDTPPRDADGDGVPDARDEDSDGNGIDDDREGMGDADGDGIPDYADLDDDNDRLTDVEEIEGRTDFPRDSDDDRIPDFRDPDSDGDNIGDADEGTLDTDGDGTPDRRDFDSDGDTIRDIDEAGDDDLSTPPIDSDDDGLPDYRDLDADNDGIADDIELENGTDPTLSDSDGDGVSDLIEAGAGTDPLDGTVSPRTRGDFVFVVPFDEDPMPRRDTLNFRTNIQFADVYFLMDTTGSMISEISAMRTAVTGVIDNVTCTDFGTSCTVDAECDAGQACSAAGTCISDPEASGCIASLWTGVGTFEGNENSYRNLLSLQGDPSVTQRSIPSDADGGGASETLFESIACVADPTACRSAGCDSVPMRVGCPAYRSEAIRILVGITDEDNECTGCTVNTATEAATRLRTAGITFVGVDADDAGDPRDDLTSVARLSDSLDGTGEPLYFTGDAARVTDAVTDAIREIALGVPLFVVIDAEDLPDDDGDAMQFIRRIEVNLSGEGCSDEPTSDLDLDGFDDTFPFLRPGTPVCWDVVARRNTTVRPTRVPQVFKAELTVLGDDSPLDRRTIFFLVPPNIEPPVLD
ncbi:MAG TPA: hypothetical protein RMH99_18690 [Sandaracinaceae bacterium LLY-WYZ-13_1]|nr:hypothetical protein [Sandaracinaceae bacterium LLY-WYZ-13_1]